LDTKNTFKSITLAIVLAGILLFSSCATLTQASLTTPEKQEMTHYVLTKLAYNEDQLVTYFWGPVSAGTQIMGTKEHVSDVPSAGYVLYIDLHPTANLFHPVQYVFITQDTAQITVFDATSPPANPNDYQRMDSAIGRTLMAAQNRRAPIPGGQQPSFHSGDDNRYAVLMNGGYDSGNNHIRYWDDLQNIFLTLKYVYGFVDGNIITLCSDGTNPAPDQDNGQSSPLDFDNDGHNDIMYPCLHDTVISVFTNLAANLSAGDKLFVFTTDHGNGDGVSHQTEENLWNYETLQDYEFAGLLALFPDCEKLFTLEPCFSGGFLDDAIVPPGPVVGSTAANYNEYSWAMGPDYVYDTYVFHWTAAMKGEDAYGVPVHADANGDGVITFDEAYAYAISMDHDQEHPQYGDYPQDCGKSLSLWVSNPPPENITKPAGTTHCITGRAYTYTTSATEPENEQICYQFNWGDGNLSDWTDFVVPGTIGSASHAWGMRGNYSVRARAKDTAGSKSKWSDPLNIVVVDLPTLSIQKVRIANGRIHATVKNVGTMNSRDMNWTISVKGGLVLFGRAASAQMQHLYIGVTTDISTKFLLGFGTAKVTIKLETQGEIFERNATAKLMFTCKDVQFI